MTHYIQTGDYQIHPVAGHIWHQGETVKVRPKTFELLLLLTEARGELVSKQEILRRVWDDVSVDEQVVFQSIKELRKIFHDADAIKTVPRKGYAWTLPVEEIDLTKQRAQEKTDDTPTDTLRWRFPAILGFGLLLVLVIWAAFQKEDKSTLEAGAVIVLPVASNLSDTDHTWVRYGAMDHLIRRLPASDHFGVYQTIDVLDVIKRAGISAERFSHADISRIFSVTGAALIVEAKLGGTPHEYQLLYTLHERSNTEKGVLLADRVENGLDRLAARITQKIGKKNLGTGGTYYSDFANEMMAAALEHMQTEDFASAEKYLEAAVKTEPDNMAAKRLLAHSLVAQNKSEKAASVLEDGLQHAEATDSKRELARLYYLKGIHKLQNRDFQAGLDFLSLAADEAEALKDWLYLGYISEYKGHAKRALGDLPAAQEHYRTAIEYHQIIQCPYGQAMGLLNMARTAHDLGDEAGAQSNTQSALEIIENRDLRSLEAEASRWAATLDKRMDQNSSNP
ncbi:winged helix-turn-helix domain-containing protein [Kordiimonas sp. SCSIO 12603]|uniref:winged helix-turn-helix domain-containing protein n=1 Tax=Kordiimonas sp. SCSIO 12603 TaxID=2829596 RepID=UPI002104AC96|nr:winged helix-turn-helix domain-containing protein [Kordiimonas sp. SCSIO 12603]UTW59540.1 winged helix-turn-helix domain-containing protein [Kordiimonas sp. SCSIO 12603]